MRSERQEVRGLLTLSTLLKVSLVSGLALGGIFGVFTGVVGFMAGGGFSRLFLFVFLGPFAMALLLSLVTVIGHPLFTALARVGVPGLDRISFEPISPEPISSDSMKK